MRLQFIAFFNMIIAGFIIALLFNLYTFCLNKIRVKSLIKNIFDFIYCILAFFIIFTLLQLGNRLEIRFFIYPAISLGGYIYVKTLNNFTTQFLEYLSKIIS